MMKNQFGFLILNGGMGYLVSTLFSGFLVAYIPFPFSYSFKGMLQRGIETNPNISASFLSALPFYFIVLLGCGEVVNLFLSIIGLEAASNSQIDFPMMNQQGKLIIETSNKLEISFSISSWKPNGLLQAF